MASSTHSADPPSLLELYCGIGGCSQALGTAARPSAAIDINRTALEVLAANGHPNPVALHLGSVDASTLVRWRAELWWLSPPCQPFTRRGRGRDDEDPRSRSLLHLVEVIRSHGPAYLGLENVPGFSGSRTHQRLRQALDEAGYRVRESVLCPTELGVPNRRRRYYLVAAREGLRDGPKPEVVRRPLADFLDPAAAHDPRLRVEPEVVARYELAIDVVDPEDPAAVAATFTSAYGRSPVRSGSYLRVDGGVRRFSPREILNLLGFPAGFRLPSSLPLANAWRLVGNSLSLPAVRSVLAPLPCFALPLAP